MAGVVMVVFASFRPKPGHEKDVEQILKDMVEPTRAEPENLLYDLYSRKDDTGAITFHLFEKYGGPTALDAHRATSHYKDYRAAIIDHLAEPIGVLVLNAIDVED